MPNQTPIYGFRSPLATGEGADGPVSIQNLAQDVEDDLAAGAGFRSYGKLSVPAEQSTASSTYVELGTPDRVSGIVLPADGLILVRYRALYKGSAKVSVFLGENEVKVIKAGAAPESLPANGSSTFYAPVFTTTAGGFALYSAASADTLFSSNYFTWPTWGVMAIEALAGTYDVSVRWAALSGTINAKQRLLRVSSQAV